MPAYTSVLQKPLETIFWEDDNFMEELLQVVRLFRPFSAAITEFISFSSVFYILICGFLAVVLYLIRTACGVSQSLKKNKDGKGGNDL